MEEYIIISKTALEKRIEELKHQRELTSSLYDFNQISTELRILEQILFQSTPLIPEIKKAFDAGQKYGEDNACNAEIDLHNVPTLGVRLGF